MRAAIVRIFPELSAAKFTVATTGWDSHAIDVDDRLIFKFPRRESAKRDLLKEAALLAKVRPAVTMTVPNMRIHQGPPLFSEHEKLKGDHLLSSDYDKLPEEARRRLGNDLAQFYSELHRLDANLMRAIGAAPIKSMQAPEAIRSNALSALPADLGSLADETVRAFVSLPPDPYGSTYGFFDGHGWNMAFDHARCRLNGIYDFADSGIGPLHQEFIYSNFISTDLTERIVTSYEALTGRSLDRRRISLLTGMHRLSELSEFAADSGHVANMIRGFTQWAASTTG